MESSAKQETQPKPRLIVRLGVFLASHHILFRFTLISPYVCSLNPSFGPFFLTHPSPFEISVICCFAGIIALLLLPSLAKNTYLSENALIPGNWPSSLFLLLWSVNVYLLLAYCYRCYLFLWSFWGSWWVSFVGYPNLLGRRFCCCHCFFIL